MKKKLIISSCILLCSLGAFFLLSKSVQRGMLRQFDFDTTVRIQAKIPLLERFGGDELWEDISFFVSPPVSVLWVMVVALLVAVAGFRHADTSQKIVQSVLAGGILLAFTILVGIEMYGKDVIRQRPPPHFMLKNPSTIFPKFYVSEEYSYPSGHAGRAAFLSIITLGYIAHRLNDNIKKSKFILLGGLFCVFAFLISIGKIYLGHHWFSDILAGWILGSGFGISSILLIPPKRKYT